MDKSQSENTLLRDILTAQVLVLANQLKSFKEAKGTQSTSDYTTEAIRLINQKKLKILQTLRASS